jgi:hypothetical protein
VVTARAADSQPIGLTVNSVVAVSLEPPLVAWSLATRSDSLSAFLAAPYFALNVLAEDQEAISRRFRAPAPDLRRDHLGARTGRGTAARGLPPRPECRAAPDRGYTTGCRWARQRLAYTAASAPLVFASRYDRLC